MKKLVIVLLTAVLVTFLAFYLKRDKSDSTGSSPASQTERAAQSSDKVAQADPKNATDPVKTYTMEEVAAHGADPDSEECWTVIHDKVYDILEFASNSHPGGELIFEACGKDATELFETRPQGSGTPHSENARKILEQYYIGDLKK